MLVFDVVQMMKQSQIRGDSSACASNDGHDDVVETGASDNKLDGR